MDKEKFDITFKEMILILKVKYNIKNAIIRELINNSLITVASFGYGENEANLIISIGRGITGLCAKDNKIIVINDIENYTGEYIKGIENAKSELCIPLKKNGKVIGTFNIESSDKNNFNEDKVKSLESLSKMIASSINTNYSESSNMLIKAMAKLCK